MRLKDNLKDHEEGNIPTGRRAKSGSYKRPFDLTILLLAILILLPVWLLLFTFISMVVWLGDRGPIFFRQRRSGKDGRVFTVLKFRTMIPDADHKGPAWTTQGDVRLTRFGKVLRRTAMDELPELWSILNGDMSLVGPRALDVVEQRSLEQLVPGFRNRLQVRPGLTGLAQIYDRRDDANEKFRYDLQYIQRMSPLLDTKLLILSVRNSLVGKWDRRHGKPSGYSPESASSQAGDQQEWAADEVRFKVGDGR